MSPDERNESENYARKILSIVQNRHPRETFAIPNDRLALLCRCILEPVERHRPANVVENKLLAMLEEGPKSVAELHEAAGYRTIMVTKNLLERLREAGRIRWDSEEVSLA